MYPSVPPRSERICIKGRACAMNSQPYDAQTPLRVATWNCNMAFRNKCEQLLSLAPDIAVIQECERPSAGPTSAQAQSCGAATTYTRDWPS